MRAESKRFSPPVPLVGANAAAGPVSCKHLVALPIKHETCLFQFAEAGAPEEATRELPFVALGSGQPIADPLPRDLRVDVAQRACRSRRLASSCCRASAEFGQIGSMI